MPRLMLTDERWSKLKAILLEDRVYNKSEHRQTIEGILYRLRVGCPWRDLPEYFGLWNTIYRRFLLWSRKGILMRLFKSLSTDSDTEWEFINVVMSRLISMVQTPRQRNNRHRVKSGR